MTETIEALWRLRRVVPPDTIREQLDELYLRGGIPRGDLTGWHELDQFYTVGGGQWTLITGIPGMGKSEFVDALNINLAERGDWSFSIFSPENFPVAAHVAKLIEKRTRKPFNVGPTPRMTTTDYTAAAAWVMSKFTWIAQAEQAPLDILSTGLAYGRKGSKHGIVIDPWNALDHYDAEWRPPGMTETEYVSSTLSRIGGMLRDPNNANVHLWVIAHPAKLYRGNDGKYPLPTGYDISGSAHWFNKADNILVINRDKNQNTQDVEIYAQKIRFKNIGRVGMATLKYDRVTGRYFEFDAPPIHDLITGKGEHYVDPESAAERAAIIADVAADDDDTIAAG
jgi:twinkle protein